MYPGGNFYGDNLWPQSVAFGIAGLIIGAIGWFLNNRSKTMVQTEDGEEIEIKSPHDFFYVPMHYWGLILLAISLIMTVVHYTR